MNGIKLFKKFLMPCGLCAAVPAVKPVPPPGDCPEPCALDEKKLIRPSELPIYTVEGPCSKQIPCPDPDACQPSFMEQGFGAVRKTVNIVFTEYSVVVDSVNNSVEKGLAHSEFLLDYLKEDSNVLPRLGAIGIGGLTGLILGLRGGTIKRLIYSSTGAQVVAAICYPKQTAESVALVKHYANISYNFAMGVKPGDEQLQISWPELPTVKIPSSLSEFVDLAVETGSAAGAVIGSLASKATEAINESKEAKSTENKPKQS